MPLTEKHRRQIVHLFCILFYLLMVYKWFSGLFLYELQPAIYNTRFDLVTWLFMETGIHQWLLNNHTGWIIFDVAFYAMPFLFLLAYKINLRLSCIAAALMWIVHFTYIQCYTLYPSNSIESFTPWLLFPLLFMAVHLKNFYFILQGLRYFFLFVFASAGVWKLYQQGFLNISQMSGVLLFQHKEYLVSSPANWYSHFIYWLISHPSVSYFLYAAATLLELSFAVGFFTKKYDRLLSLAFILFIFLDVLLMRIHYWETVPFLITLLYSRYSMPGVASAEK